MKKTLPDFILARCRKRKGCFVWTGPLAARTSPRMSHDGERVLVRRWLVEQWFGRSSRDKILIPVCGENRCLNLEHFRIQVVKRISIEQRGKLKPRTPEYGRNNNLLRIYGISLKEWNSLFVKQGSRCAICKSKEMRGKNWHTDHDHQKGKIRGILCGWCNTGIGKLQESTKVLCSAILYIAKHKTTNTDVEKAIAYLQKPRHSKKDKS